MVKIIICDDHELFIHGVARVLQEDPDIKIIDTALNGNDLLEKLSKVTPNIILLDIHMPQMDGIETAMQVKKRYPNIKIIALSMYDDATKIHKMIKAGASGYLLKNTNSKELSTAIKTVFNGEQFFKGGVLNRIIEFSDEEKEETKIALLTRREKEILKLIADGKSNQEIADFLYISIHTVHSHRKNMLKKLNLKNTPELIKIAYKNGLI